jgi:hypothetical protein
VVTTVEADPYRFWRFFCVFCLLSGWGAIWDQVLEIFLRFLFAEWMGCNLGSGFGDGEMVWLRFEVFWFQGWSWKCEDMSGVGGIVVKS